MPQGVESLGTFTWPASEHGAGGFSGLELSDDGRTFIAISDRTRITEGSITRDTTRITAVSAAPTMPLLDRDGTAIPQQLGDSEGLARLPDGRLCISFEGDHRIQCYAATSGPAIEVLDLPFADALGHNAGIEALAADAKGRLYAIPEQSGGLTKPFPVWRLDQTWETPFSIPRRGGFVPVGADFDPDGRLYVLERAFSGFSFRSRVRRFDVSETALSNETTLIETTGFQHDNLEGLSVWRDATGAIRLTMISDDNFNALQSTQFVEYRVAP
ncbi:hypothetical protein GGQ68_000128 [Sagittula marina]|uniref:Phytase-like domain-containing protein n=1 Tax=Sagittula marina TaxID=943940 RepID=A0A7W6DN51_9RHOB|nr:esterase-like activity of phytase family protein [Sagittula marina]MBB3983817.1 hypothetical protein [Sagittula marina]